MNQQFVEIKTDSNDIIKSELPVKYVSINMFRIILYGYAACCAVVRHMQLLTELNFHKTSFGSKPQAIEQDNIEMWLLSKQIILISNIITSLVSTD